MLKKYKRNCDNLNLDYLQFWRMKKAEKLGQMFEKMKRQKIKETQDSWKSQFVETQQQKLQRMNIDNKYRDVAKERKLIDGQEEDDEETRLKKQLYYDEQARAQQFIDVDGQKIFVKGLDLNLLKKQRMLEQKRKTIPDFNSKINEKMKLAENINKIGSNKLYKEMIERIKNPKSVRTTPSFNQNTFYQFDINWTFGQLVPRVVTKHPPKHHKNPSFPNITPQSVRKMVQIISKKTQKPNVAQKQMITQNQQSDNIFDQAPQDEIQIGKKLEFGVQDIQKIYSGVTKRQQPQQDKYAFEFQHSQKRRKLMMEQEQRDYYGQCYWDAGPSLQELKNFRKQGISYFQFQDPSKNKTAQSKQKKVDYNKQYNKIQRIIAQKQGKPK